MGLKYLEKGWLVTRTRITNDSRYRQFAADRKDTVYDLLRALENQEKIAAQVIAPRHTPAASAIPCKSIFLTTEFPVTKSVVTVAATQSAGNIPWTKKFLTTRLTNLHLWLLTPNESFFLFFYQQG